MVAYEIMLKDRSVEVVEAADAYQQEGQMTTFFSTGAGRQVVDCWSTRVASFRTSEILIVRRVERGAPAEPAEPAEPAVPLVAGGPVGPVGPEPDRDGLVRLRSA